MRDPQVGINDGLIAAHFIRQSCKRFHIEPPRLPQRELERAQAYDWPGNVRELQNVVERAVILSLSGSIHFELPEATAEAAKVKVDVAAEAGVIPEREWREREKANLRAALDAANGKVSGPGGAAELLGIHPATLASRLRVLNVGKS